jgi:hypothetical protein
MGRVTGRPTGNEPQFGRFCRAGLESMRRTLPPALMPSLLLAALLAGCAESQLAGHLLYMTPYKLDEMDCADLKKKAANANAQVKSMEALRDKANTSAAGPVINSMVYGPDYNRARWDQQTYEGALARKNCDAPPAPPPAPPGAN